MTDARRPETIAATANGQENEATGGVVGAIETATTFVRDTAYRLPPSGDIYRRDDNATVRETESVIAALEGGSEAVLFPSGIAALTAVMRIHADGPVLVQSGSYYGTESLARELVSAPGCLHFYEPGDLSSLERAVACGPKLVFLETPSNPLLAVTSIAGAAEIVHRAGGLLVVDSTTATPVHTRPLSLGADIVMHSATKGLNGHSDVLAGALVAGPNPGPVFEAAKASRARFGAMPSPFDAFLLTRGMRTLFVRVPAASRAALHIAHVLEAHEKVDRVHYPGLPSHPGHAVAAAEMTGGFGGLLSFDVKGGAEAALAVAGRLRLIKRATSLGGVESMIEHRASIEPEHRGIPAGLLRLSVGIEAVDDLVDDLVAALG